MLVVAFFFKLHEFLVPNIKLRVQLPPPTNVEVA